MHVSVAIAGVPFCDRILGETAAGVWLEMKFSKSLEKRLSVTSAKS